jgi:hypothetical protein
VYELLVQGATRHAAKISQSASLDVGFKEICQDTENVCDRPMFASTIVAYIKKTEMMFVSPYRVRHKSKPTERHGTTQVRTKWTKKEKKLRTSKVTYCTDR